jgi:RNA polymerase primary sigma factor
MESAGAILPDRRERSPEAVAADAEEARQFVRLLEELGEVEAQVLRLRFGLGGRDRLTLPEVGARLGLSSERVRQIERRGLAQLARSLQSA